MAIYRLKQALNSAWLKETTAGTQATFTSAAFKNDMECDPISYEIQKIEIDVAGKSGTDYVENGAINGNVGVTLPVTTKNEANILIAAGARVSGSDFLVGGDLLSTGRIGDTAITIMQYDGEEQRVLVGAKPSKLSIKGEANKRIELETEFIGAFSRATVATPAGYQQMASGLKQNICTNSVLTLDGTVLKYKSITIDFGVETKMGEHGNTANGYGIPEVINLKPTVSIVFNTEVPATYNYFQKTLGDTPIAFSWSFGSGTNNVYTITGNFQITKSSDKYGDFMETTLEGNFMNQASGFGLKINVV